MLIISIWISRMQYFPYFEQLWCSNAKKRLWKERERESIRDSGFKRLRVAIWLKFSAARCCAGLRRCCASCSLLPGCVRSRSRRTRVLRRAGLRTACPSLYARLRNGLPLALDFQRSNFDGFVLGCIDEKSKWCRLFVYLAQLEISLFVHSRCWNSLNFRDKRPNM